MTEREDFVNVGVVGDPIALPLRIARLCCAPVWLVMPALGAVLSLLSYGRGLNPTVEENEFLMLYVYAGMGVGVLSVGSVSLAIVPRLAASTALYAGLSFILTTVMTFPLLLAFVASILYTSNAPFIIGAALTAGWWALVWPRRSTWERWMSRAQKRGV